jgi:hypothetical protein
MRWISFISVFLLAVNATGQKRVNFVRTFQFSLTPGISTNGLHPGGFTNYFSLNLTSGYSAKNLLFELGVISNLNEEETRGLQIAGLANLTGANLFSGLRGKEIEKKKHEGYEANLTGGQFSGLSNVVLNNVFGFQITGGVNVVKGALQGAQLAGIANTVGKYAFGLQLAGLYNVAAESMDGVQVASLFNITEGGLFGVQAGIFNKAGFIEGINSFNKDQPTGLQLGIVNHTKTMNGFQIGLVNISKHMQGTQVGLVNIYVNGKTPNTRDGTSIGLINIGSSAYVAVFANDLWYTNIEIATGTFKNHRINTDRKEKQIQNTLIYSPSMGSGDGETWALGYGLKKYFFSRSLAPGYNKLYFFSVGAEFYHINHVHKKLTKDLSLLSRPQVTVGSRFNPKNKRYYFFAGAAYNLYRSGKGLVLNSFLEQKAGNVKGLQHGPGFSAGILVQ